MESDPDSGELPAITALPPTAVRQLASTQVLLDPHSVVKELLENALDARAKSIFVNISANTLDSIQVKDDGHGIPAQDRPLVCRRHCTSKIRDFHDLKEVGSKWLGFRGEALASVAEMCGAISVTTRVEGEPAAVTMAYDRKGELISTRHNSHPVGTTVKVSEFFKFLPVRKQAAPKNIAKWLGKIRQLMQAYALARPSIRFGLHVLKAKNDKSNFMYAPKPYASTTKDAAIKVISKDCALQCDWAVSQANGFEVYSLLPRPNACVSKIANQGAFLSIDSRPVAGTRGTLKQVVAAFREKFHSVNPDMKSTGDPFFCMNIICPINSYDINVEPAKDDVIFEDGDVVLRIIKELLTTYYSDQAHENAGDTDIEEFAQVPQNNSCGEQLPQIRQSVTVDQERSREEIETPNTPVPQSEPHTEPAQWRKNMYGIDESDLNFLSKKLPTGVEEEDERQTADISNPWTITRMNTTIKPRPYVNGQLLSPAKSIETEGKERKSTVPPIATSGQAPSARLPTPQTSPRRSRNESAIDRELERSIQPHATESLHHHIDDRRHRIVPSPEAVHPQELRCSSTTLPQLRHNDLFPEASIRTPAGPILTTPPTKKLNQRKQQSHQGKGPITTNRGPNQRASQTARGPKQMRANRFNKRPADAEYASGEAFNSLSPQKAVGSILEHSEEDSLEPVKNTDIRNFFRQHQPSQTHANVDAMPSFTATNSSPHRNMPMDVSKTTPSELRPSSGKIEDLNARSSYHNPLFKRPRPIDTNFSSRPELLQRDSTSLVSLAEPLSRRKGLRRKSSFANNSSGSESRRSSISLEQNLGQHNQNLVLVLSIDISRIVQSFQSLDMNRNSSWLLETSTDAYNTFAMRITDEKITEWCFKIDDMLGKLYEWKPEIDAIQEIKDGVVRMLAMRHEDESVLISDDHKGQGLEGSRDRSAREVSVSILQPHEESDDPFPKPDFNMSQSIDLGPENSGQNTDVVNFSEQSTEITSTVTKKVAEEADEFEFELEFDGGLDDVMLMDL